MPIAADITDLLAGFRHSRSPSGVTRVQTRLLAAGEGLFDLVAAAPGDGVWRRFPRLMLERLLAATLRPGGPKEPDWQALVDDAEAALAAGEACEFAAGDWLLGAGTAWWLPGHAARIMALKQRTGLGYASFVYDLLPLLVPEHCEELLVRSFAQHFATLCLLADHAVCISESVRVDFQLWQKRLLPELAIPASVLRLDARFDVAAQQAGLVPAERFVLAVGTVESRKNQLGLLRAWLQLIRHHGEAAVPRLVVVGVHGFLADQVLQLHRAAPQLRRKVELRPLVPDGELQGLYAGCLFTIFDSHAEGWGLPVTESLGQGKVPVVADIAVLRESGGAHAVYVEPENVPALAAAAWSLISQPQALAAREAALRATVRLRSWRELAEECAAFLAPGPPPAPALPRDRARLAEDMLVYGGLPPMPDLPQLHPAAASSGALQRLGQGWSHQEEWGSWAVADGPALLRLPLDPGWRCPELSVLLVVMAPPGGHAGRARPQGGAWCDWVLLGSGIGELRVDAPWPVDDVLVLEFEVGAGVIVPPDERRLGFGIMSLRVVRQLPAEAGSPPGADAPPVWQPPRQPSISDRLRFTRED
ncbi:glycosyltransferase [Rhodovarius sp.]|uniref:glycosyltransferase n=1 Tax=Rhodovarius sp. TaxID=2972673 RepID=UPI0033424622